MLLLLVFLLPAAAAPPIQCTSSEEKPNWPTYHFMNNVTRNASGALSLEPLNDANAIAEYRGEARSTPSFSLPRGCLLLAAAPAAHPRPPLSAGIFHVMMQEGGGNWSHGVSNNMVKWFLVEDALDSGRKSIGFPDVGPCDGSFSYPNLGPAPYNGSTPVIVYDAACGVPLGPRARARDIQQLRSADDVDRLEVARPADPSDPYLREWTKTLPGPVQFDGPPCAFPSRVWRSESATQQPTWNMLCNVHGNESWSRFVSTTPTLM